jgi:tRNA nucleotidyltransferase/poly(A) polymerase
METFEFYEVGGCVRDSLLGLSSKDVDFSVVAPEGAFFTADSAFLAMEAQLAEQGFQIFESRREFLTIRARVPKGHALEARTAVADFVLALTAMAGGQTGLPLARWKMIWRGGTLPVGQSPKPLTGL